MHSATLVQILALAKKKAITTVAPRSIINIERYWVNSCKKGYLYVTFFTDVLDTHPSHLFQ